MATDYTNLFKFVLDFPNNFTLKNRNIPTVYDHNIEWLVFYHWQMNIVILNIMWMWMYAFCIKRIAKLAIRFLTVISPTSQISWVGESVVCCCFVCTIIYRLRNCHTKCVSLCDKGENVIFNFCLNIKRLVVYLLYLLFKFVNKKKIIVQKRLKTRTIQLFDMKIWISIYLACLVSDIVSTSIESTVSQNDIFIADAGQRNNIPQDSSVIQVAISPVIISK